MGRHFSLDLVDHGTQLDFPAVYLSGKPLLFRSLLPSQERVPRGGLANQPIQGLTIWNHLPEETFHSSSLG